MTTRTRLLAALGTAGLALSLALTGCSRAESVPEADLSGSPVTVSEETNGLCEAIVSQTLPVEAADALAQGSGYTTRVIVIDGTPQAVTQDLREDRLNFEVENDLVVKCTVG